MKDKCNSRLNVLKILSHKSWGLTKTTLVAIYKSLIGSVIDYSAFSSSQIVPRLEKSIQAIQNQAVRIIFKQKYDAHTVDLCALAVLPRVSDRMFEQSEKYLWSALVSSNSLICELVESFLRSFPERGMIKKPTPLCAFRYLFECDLH